MEKEFVLFEEASALKKLGFDNPCFGYYENQDKNLVISFNNTPLTEEQKKRPGLYKIDHRNSVLPQWATAAPIYSQVFKWFRDEYELFGEVLMYIPQEGKLDGCFTYVFTISEVQEYKKKPNVNNIFHNSQEEAELDCIKKLIELVSKNQL